MNFDDISNLIHYAIESIAAIFIGYYQYKKSNTTTKDEQDIKSLQEEVDFLNIQIAVLKEQQFSDTKLLEKIDERMEKIREWINK